MWKIIVFKCFLLLMVIKWQCEALPKTCEEKEKSWALFELAKESIEKAKNHISACDNEYDKTRQNTCLCGKNEKSTAYLDVALKLLHGAEHYYPACDFENVTVPDEQKCDNKTLPSDCVEVQQRGQRKSGIYTIRLFNETANIDKIVDVYCDMDTDGGGWTVIQRRAMYSRQENFDRGWMEYKHGFGNLHQEFWIGNDIIHDLTNTGSNVVRFDMRDIKGDKVYAFYKFFNVANESDGYRLSIGNYSGNAGDSMVEHSNKCRFSTKDRLHDGDKICTTYRKGGWWYSSICSENNPNGPYRPGVEGVDDTIYWYTWKNVEGLSFFEIKTKNTCLFQ